MRLVKSHGVDGKILSWCKTRGLIISSLCSPNETKKPRSLSKLSDTSAWEKRRTKGKIAIQKMVVDLMELYLHRLKQRRPPYPKSLAMDEFTSLFPYKPTQDQQQVYHNFYFIVSFSSTCHSVLQIFISALLE